MSREVFTLKSVGKIKFASIQVAIRIWLKQVLNSRKSIKQSIKMAKHPSKIVIITIIAITSEITIIIVIIIRINNNRINLVKIHNSLSSTTKLLKITQQHPQLLEIKINFRMAARSFAIHANNQVIPLQIAHRILKTIQLHKQHQRNHGHKN